MSKEQIEDHHVQGYLIATLERIKKTANEKEAKEMIQLPFWPELKRVTPNSLIRSALFSAIQSKDRQYLDQKVLYSQQGIAVKYTGKQLNQEDLSLWETLVHIARESPLGNECNFTAYGILKTLGVAKGTSGGIYAKIYGFNLNSHVINQIPSYQSRTKLLNYCYS